MWMLTNAALAIIIENISGTETNAEKVETELRARQNAYFTFILWATFGLSAVRFMGVRPCATNLRRRRISCSHGCRVVPVVLLQAQYLQVIPQELEHRALRANACRGAFIVVLALPGVFRRHIIVSLRPHAHVFNSPRSNKNTEPNLTFYSDGLAAFCLKIPPIRGHDTYLAYLAFTAATAVDGRTHVFTLWTFFLDMNAIFLFLFSVHYRTAYGQIHRYKEDEGRLVDYSQAIWSAQSAKPRGPQPVLKRSGAKWSGYKARRRGECASGLTTLACMCDTAARVCRRGSLAA